MAKKTMLLEEDNIGLHRTLGHLTRGLIYLLFTLSSMSIRYVHLGYGI